MSTQSPGNITQQSWLLLVALSVLWGGSFLFVGVAVKELPPLLVVFARVAIAVIILLPVHLAVQGALPRTMALWISAAGMSILNNVLPFTLIALGQSTITAGLASVINATTPLFGAAIMAIAGAEALTPRKITGLILGVTGVVVLRGLTLTDLDQETRGVLAVLAASACYGLSSLWAKKRLQGVPPLTSATCQLMCSTVIMGVLVMVFANASQYSEISTKTAISILLLASVSTALAYLIFFKIIADAGASVVLLVTMLIPASAILFGVVFLDEQLSTNEIIGALIIGLALVIIDGRALRWTGLR